MSTNRQAARFGLLTVARTIERAKVIRPGSKHVNRIEFAIKVLAGEIDPDATFQDGGDFLLHSKGDTNDEARENH